MAKITSFTGEYRFLSNFYAYEFIYGGQVWATAEHAYQAAKATNMFDFAHIREAATPGEAKRRAHDVVISPRWDAIKPVIMFAVVRAKFQVPYLAGKLLSTGDAELIEGNTWGDVFWGTCNGVGENHLGRLLMHVRDELRYGLR